MIVYLAYINKLFSLIFNFSKMHNHQNISKLVYSIISSLILLALLIFILPFALILVLTLVLFSILAGIIFRFILAKKGSDINFTYKNQMNSQESCEMSKTTEMKDVTYSNYKD